MEGITHRYVQTNSMRMHIAEAGKGPLVILLHGFPELWYSWHHQLPDLATAGYHAVAPDLRGYGETDAPPAIESYSMLNMTADIAGLLDALGEEQAVLVGNDWGANIVWWCARRYPERIAAVVALNIPYEPHPPASTRMIKQWAGRAFNFALAFQEPGRAEAELEADVRRSLRLFLYAFSGDAPVDLIPMLFTGKAPDARVLDGMPEPPGLPSWLTEADLDYCTRVFLRTGFRGALNRYRNLDRDWQELADLSEVSVEQPVFFIGGERDSTVRFANIGAMQEALPKLRKVLLLAGCGHWTQQERPVEVTTEIIKFLQHEIPS